jgi:hypothetical protein
LEYFVRSMPPPVPAGVLRGGLYACSCKSYIQQQTTNSSPYFNPTYTRTGLAKPVLDRHEVVSDNGDVQQKRTRRRNEVRPPPRLSTYHVELQRAAADVLRLALPRPAARLLFRRALLVQFRRAAQPLEGPWVCRHTHHCAHTCTAVLRADEAPPRTCVARQRGVCVLASVMMSSATRFRMPISSKRTVEASTSPVTGARQSF